MTMSLFFGIILALNPYLLSAVDPGTCSNSFVVTRPGQNICDTYGHKRVAVLQQRVAELEAQLDQLTGHNVSEGDDVSSEGHTPNPSFRCECDNTATFSFAYKDCQDIAKVARAKSGIYDITPITNTTQVISIAGSSQKYWGVTTLDPVTVYCDIKDGNGWTVLMRRSKMDVDFNRTWDDYKHGFGNMTGDGDFWLGLETMHLLTTHPFTKYILWIKIIDKNQTPFVFPYSSFKVLDEESGYRLILGQSFGKYQQYFYSGNKFIARKVNSPSQTTQQPVTTTRHRYYNRETYNVNECLTMDTESGGGGWWFNFDPNRHSRCGNTNLNAPKPYWYGITTDDIQSVEMKMKPAQ